jgi:hypothetical protein
MAVSVGSLSASPTGIDIDNNKTCIGTPKTLSVVGGTLGTGGTWQWFTGSCGGTAAGTGPSITVDPLAGTITTYYVRASGACNTTACIEGTVIVSPASPAQPGVITGATPVCPATAGLTYSVVPVTDATTYNWSVQEGWTITGGQGTTSITVTSGATGQNGNVSVTAFNSCGTGPVRNMAVTVNPGPPATPGIISGGTEQCINKSGLTYSVLAVPNATSYTWTVPTGWTIASGQGTTSITVNTGAAATNGNLTVTASNSCGSSTAQTMAVVVNSAAPAALVAPIPALGQSNSICPVATNLRYSIPTISNATNYTWNFPSGWTIISGQGTPSVNVTAGVQPVGNKSISVTVTNSCGSSTSPALVIPVNTFAFVNAGPDQFVCVGTSQLQLDGTIDGATTSKDIQWSSTIGDFHPNDKTVDPIYKIPDAFVGSINITLSAKGEGTCPFVSDNTIITVKPNPTASLSVTGNNPICSGSSSAITFHATANTKVTYTVNGGSRQRIRVDASGTAILNTGVLNSTTVYRLDSVAYIDNNECIVVASGNATITVNPVPVTKAGGPDAVCQSPTPSAMTLSGAIISGGATTGAWSITSGGGTLSNTAQTFNPAAVTYTPPPNFNGTVMLTLTTNALPGCSPISATRIINVNKLSTVNAGGPDIVCQSPAPSAIALSGATVGGGATTGAWSITSGGGSLSATSQTANPAAVTYTPAANFSGTVTLTLTTNAPTGCSAAIATRTITINAAPAVNAGGPDIICQSTNPSPIILSGASIGGGAITGAWSISDGGGTLSNSAHTSNPAAVTYTPEANFSGKVTLTLTTNAPPGCSGISSTRTITINSAPTANTGGTDLLCQSASPSAIALSGASLGGGAITGAWSITSGGGTLSNTDQTNNPSTVTYTPAANFNGTITLTLTTNAPPGCSEISAVKTIIINPLPTVNAGSNQTICSGNTVTLNGQVNGSVTSGYWSGGAGTFSPNRNALNAIYTPSGAEIAAGTVILTLTSDDPPGPCLPVSASTTITINKAVEILTNPSNTGVCAGGQADLNVVANGSELVYQWYRDGVPVNNSIKISGAKTQTLHFNTVSITDDGTYYVMIGGVAPCPPVQSNSVTLNVDAAITIVKQPDSQTKCEGTTVTFVVNADANGAQLSYQWRKNGFNIPGAASMIYSIANVTTADAGNYDVVINGLGGYACSSAQSSTASLVVNTKGTINLTSGNQNSVLCTTESLTAIKYTIGGSATDVKLSGELPPGVSGFLNAGVYTISGTPAATGIFNYTVTTTGSQCSNPSMNGTITVNGNGTINLTGGGANTKLCVNTPLSPITYSIGGNATGATWSGNLPQGVNGTFSNGLFIISGTPTEQGIFNFTVTSTGSSCLNPSTSGTITVTQNGNISLSGGNPNPKICVNSALSSISYTQGGSATGIVLSGQLPPGVTTSFSGGVFTIAGTPTNSGIFSYTVSAIGPCQNNSLSGTITIDPPSNGGSISPAISTACTTINTGTLTLDGYNGTILRWESSVNAGFSWTQIPNTSNTYTYTNLPLTTIFRVVIRNGTCSPAYSVIARVNVVPLFTPIVTATTTDICLGESTVLTATTDLLPDTVGMFIGGLFNQANPPGWRITENGVVTSPFPAAGDNRAKGPWAETNGPKSFCGISFDGADRKFAIVNGPTASTMETPIFNLIGMSSAALTFKQAYKLSAGSTAQVELSLDGGNTYNIILKPSPIGSLYTGMPNVINPISLDMSSYLGMDNLRIRFNYASTSCDSWAIDDIAIPTPAADVSYVWKPTETLSPATGSPVTATPDKTTTYTLTMYIAGCPAVTNPITIYVVNNPIVTTTNACVGGGSVMFKQENGPHGGTWTVTGGGTITSEGVFTPTTPGCFIAAYTTANGVCSGKANFVVFPVAPVPVVNAGCGPVTVTPPPSIAGFNIEYSFDNGSTWRQNVPPTEDNCSGYRIKTRYILAAACGATPAGAASPNPVCSESPAFVRVVDNEKPRVTCPPSVNGVTNHAECFATGINLGTPVVTDNCSAPVLTNNAPSQFPIGTTLVTWTVTDACGNITTCTQTVIISDNGEPPAITCPPDVVQTALPGNCALDNVIIEYPQITDNCGVASLTWNMIGATNGNSPTTGFNYVSGRTFNVGLTKVTYIAADAAGNSSTCSFNVTIKDLVKPEFTPGCPAGITANVDAGSCTASIEVPVPEVNDPCGEGYSMVNSFNNTNNASGSYPVGTTKVIWTITDASGNINTCTQTITVVDNIKPVITSCPSNVTAVAAPPLCEVPSIVVGNPEYSDNCPGAVLTWIKNGATTGSGTGLVNNTVFEVGITTVTYNVTDPSGNSANCSFTVTVSDKVPPTIVSCPPSTITANADIGKCTAALTITTPVANDPCGEIVSITNDFNGTGNASGPYPVGETKLIWTIEDRSGNKVYCNQTITVTDTQSPVITCPPNATDLITDGGCTKISSIITKPAIVENCGIASLTYTLTGATVKNSPSTGTNYADNETYNIGVTTVTYTVIDVNGLSAICSHTVTIKNLDAPKFSFTCPGNVTVPAGNNSCNASVTVPAPVISNPCNETYTITNDSPYKTSDFNASGNYPVGTTIIHWTVTNGSGTAKTCDQTVTVTDLNPTLSCPANITVPADFEKHYASNVPVPPPDYGDNCPNPVLTWTMKGATAGGSGETSGTNVFPNPYTFNTGVTTITYKLTDSNNNSVECSFTVTVLAEPDIDCQPSKTVNTDNGVCTATLDPGFPVKLSGAEPITYTWTMTGATVASGTGVIGNYTFNLGKTIITWRAENVSGYDECSQDIIVIDNIPPVLAQPPVLTVCVESLKTAIYNAANMDINPDRPEYYLFKQGSTVLDLDPSTFSDNCNLNCTPIEIRWQINMNDGTSLSGRGQPSTYGADIQFKGDGITFKDVIHTITYRIVDCSGNVSDPVVRIITVQPRPNIIKVTN